MEHSVATVISDYHKPPPAGEHAHRPAKAAEVVYDYSIYNMPPPRLHGNFEQRIGRLSEPPKYNPYSPSFMKHMVFKQEPRTVAPHGMFWAEIPRDAYTEKKVTVTVPEGYDRAGMKATFRVTGFARPGMWVPVPIVLATPDGSSPLTRGEQLRYQAKLRGTGCFGALVAFGL